mmetsp:Transcript_91255/g.254099  ORF Transcript_91255/g.254099 Transcript_91255/m.254099 type:complete len:210 (-) Transcript_91255:759-1388(-)
MRVTLACPPLASEAPMPAVTSGAAASAAHGPRGRLAPGASSHSGPRCSSGWRSLAPQDPKSPTRCTWRAPGTRTAASGGWTGGWPASTRPGWSSVKLAASISASFLTRTWARRSTPPPTVQTSRRRFRGRRWTLREGLGCLMARTMAFLLGRSTRSHSHGALTGKLASACRSHGSHYSSRAKIQIMRFRQRTLICTPLLAHGTPGSSPR